MALEIITSLAAAAGLFELWRIANKLERIAAVYERLADDVEAEVNDA